MISTADKLGSLPPELEEQVLIKLPLSTIVDLYLAAVKNRRLHLWSLWTVESEPEFYGATAT
jgi:hypothetical protein